MPTWWSSQFLASLCLEFHLYFSHFLNSSNIFSHKSTSSRHEHEMHILKISALLLVKNNSLLAIVYTCLRTVLQSLFLGLCGVCSCFTMFWLLQERSWNCFFFFFFFHKQIQLLKSLYKSNCSWRNSNINFSTSFTTFTDNWFFKRWLCTAQHFFNPFSHHRCIKKSHFSEPSDFWFGNIKWLWLFHWRSPLYTIAIVTKTFLDFIIVLILILFDLWLIFIFFFKGEKFPHMLCEWLNAVKIILFKSYILAADRSFIVTVLQQHTMFSA